MTTSTTYQISLPDCESNDSFGLHNYNDLASAHAAATDATSSGLCSQTKALAWTGPINNIYTCTVSGTSYTYDYLTPPGDITINKMVTTYSYPPHPPVVTFIETDACGYL